MEILIFFFTILYFILSWKRLDLAVTFLLALLPTYMIRFKILGVPSTVLELIILISFFVWTIRKTEFLNFLKRTYKIKDYLKNRKKRTPYPFRHEIVGMLIVSFVAVGVSGFSNSAFGIWKAYFFEPVLVFILILNVLKNKKGFILWPLVVSAFFVSTFAIYQKLTGQFIFNEFWAVAETRRVTSFFPYPNAVGLYLGPVILVATGWLLHLIRSPKTSFFSKNKNCRLSIIDYRILFIISAIIISCFAIYFAKSEGAVVAVFCALTIFTFLGFKKLRFYFTIFLLILIFGIASYAPTRNFAFNKITLSDLSGEIRKQQWKETFDMLLDGKIIQGSGLNNYQKKIKPYHQEGIFFNSDNDPEFHRKTVFNEEYRIAHWQPTEIYLYPHNFFLNFWTELGFFGMLLFLWILVKFFIVSKKIINEKNKFLVLGLVSAMLVILIHGAVDVPYFKNDLAILFWVLIAILGIAKLENEKT